MCFSHLPPPAASHTPQPGAHVGPGGGEGGADGGRVRVGGGEEEEQERAPELLVATTIGGTVRVWDRRLQAGQHSSAHEGPWASTGRLKVSSRVPVCWWGPWDEMPRLVVHARGYGCGRAGAQDP